MFDLELIGLRIKEIRKSKKISQEKLAEIISMNTRSILRLENSQTIPTLETLNKIAKALDVDINEFFNKKTIKTRKEIIKDINNCINKMNDKDLNKFYNALYNYIN